MMISKIELKCFQINLMFESFTCLRLELLELFLKIYSLKENSNFWSQVFGKFFVVYIFPWIYTFFHVFPNKNRQVNEIQNQKTMLLKGNKVNPTIKTQKITKLNCVSLQWEQM